MEDVHREEVPDLIENVTTLREEQPKIIQDMYSRATLFVLHKVKLPKSPELNINIPTFQSSISKNQVDNIILDTEKLKSKLIEQIQVLHIMNIKKNCALTKMFKNPD